MHNSEHGALKYNHSSRRAKNCVHVIFGPSPMLATITTKKIQKDDDEILYNRYCRSDLHM